MSAAENVAFPLRTLTDLTEREIRTRVEECLRVVELPGVGGKRPAELSGGMQKRVALARAIAAGPTYLLYDEPTSGLDPETSLTINDLIERLDDELGVTSVVVTHDMHSVLQVADRVGFIHEGVLRWTGALADLAGADDPVLHRFIRANEYQIR
jgi:phospholipid/cholesterol/gamma-HCH transport system ATP-binding protein